MKKHNFTAAVLILLLQFMGTSCGLTLNSKHALVPLKKSGSQHRISDTVQPKVSGPNSPAFDYGAQYRPPIIDFKYQGGLVLTKPIHIYIVWYGTWAVTEKNLVKIALSSLTPASAITQVPNLSNLWKVVTKFSQQGSPATFVTTQVTVVGEADAGATVKTINSDNDPLIIILNNLEVGSLPLDLEQGVYLVLAASDITYSNEPTYCGWHNSVCLQGAGNPTNCSSPASNLVYSFVPTPTDKFRGCNIFNPVLIPGTPPNFAVSTSGLLDSVINAMMHELLELATDPYPNSIAPAWVDDVTENSEVADLCAYTFVAGEWFYCQLPDIYPDFDTSIGQCLALGGVPGATDPPRSLTDPKSGVAFSQYGVGGSQFMVQKIWSLANKGCVSQPEGRCPAGIVKLTKSTGKIQRGLFFNGVGLQAYAPGQSCVWHLAFRKNKKVTFTFDILALSFDDLDYVTITKAKNVVVKKLTRMGKNIKVTSTGKDFTVRFVTYGGRSPNPISAGFIMHYKAV